MKHDTAARIPNAQKRRVRMLAEDRIYTGAGDRLDFALVLQERDRGDSRRPAGACNDCTLISPALHGILCQALQSVSCKAGDLCDLNGPFQFPGPLRANKGL